MFTPFLAGILLTIAAANYVLTRWFIRYAKVRRLTDIPNPRSSHTVPTPKGGGVGFVVVTLLALLVYQWMYSLFESEGLITFLIILSAVAMLGWYDDKKELSRRLRFAVQSVSAIAVLIFISGLNSLYLPFAGSVELGIFGSVIALLWLTGTANIYNFMDGIDGIATVQAIGTASGWILFSWIWSIPELFAVNLFILMATAVFLLFNWPPAKIFMGDVGSLFLGFAFAVMPFLASYLSGSVHVGTTLWVGVILLWPFLFDGTYTIMRRLSRGENIFEAHRSHLYQRLNISGWSHASISLLYFFFTLMCVGLAFIFWQSGDTARMALAVILITLSFGFAAYVTRVESREEVLDVTRN